MAAVAGELEVTMAERLQGLSRRWRLFVWCAVIGVVVTIALTLLLPPSYRSTATILIEQQQVPQELVRSTITSFADERVQVISQRVMTSQNLMRIIERYDLYPYERRTRAREAVLDRMKDDVRLKMISANVVDPRSSRPIQATIAFTLSYDNRSAETSARVANELTSLYLSENLSMRTSAAQQTATFLGEEAERLRADIRVSSEAIARFKERHADALPELAMANFQLSDRTELDLRDVTARIASLDTQILAAETQLRQISPTAQVYGETGQRITSPADRLRLLKADLASLKARYQPGHPDIVRAEREIAGLESEVGADDSANDVLRKLDEARGRLAAAREHYTPDHPDVLRLTREVTLLEQQAKDAPAAERVQRAREGADNLAYLQYRTQVTTLKADRTAAEKKAAELRTRLDELSRRVSRAPEVENEYRALNRDYENAQLKYQDVRTKQREAEAGQNLETERKGERFTLIEPPVRPEQPVSPNRPVLLVLGIVASLAIALGVVLARDAVDSSVRGVRDLTRLVEVPPLAVIPAVETLADRSRRRRIARLSWSGSVAVIAVAAVLVHVLWRPLDIVWFALMRRMGL